MDYSWLDILLSSAHFIFLSLDLKQDLFGVSESPPWARVFANGSEIRDTFYIFHIYLKYQHFQSWALGVTCNGVKWIVVVWKSCKFYALKWKWNFSGMTFRIAMTIVNSIDYIENHIFVSSCRLWVSHVNSSWTVKMSAAATALH